MAARASLSSASPASPQFPYPHEVIAEPESSTMSRLESPLNKGRPRGGEIICLCHGRAGSAKGQHRGSRPDCAGIPSNKTKPITMKTGWPAASRIDRLEPFREA